MKNTPRKPKKNCPRCLVCGRPLKRRQAIDAGMGAGCALKLLAVRK